MLTTFDRSSDIVCSHDDITYQSIAKAFGLPLKLHEVALEKMKKKGLHAIVANDISRKDIAFGSDYNAGVMLFADGASEELPRMTKREMADRILDLVRPRLTHKP